MNRNLRIIIVLNTLGLSVASVLENWRPGLVTSGVDLGIVWVGALLTSCGALLLHRRR